MIWHRSVNGVSIRAVSLQAIGVGKSFGSFQALKDVTLDVGRGEFLTLLGPSGSGKTTFLMIVAGFEQPTVGRLMSEGEDITQRSAETRSFGMVFQGYALFPHMTVAQNIAFPLQVRKTPRDVIARRVGEIIERVGLNGHESKLPAKLSGGQQQRVALARALVFEPSVLLLDEPFSALDKHLRGRMQDEVKRLHQEFGTTFIFVTHDQSEALSLSSRIAIFNHGELLQIAAPQEVYERPTSRFVAEFLGEINLLPVEDIGHCAHRHRRAVRRRPSRRPASGSRQEERRSGGAAGAHVRRRLLSGRRERCRGLGRGHDLSRRLHAARARHPRRDAADGHAAGRGRGEDARGRPGPLGHVAGDQGLPSA